VGLPININSPWHVASSSIIDEMKRFSPPYSSLLPTLTQSTEDAVISTNTSNDPKFVCQALSHPMSLTVNHHHRSSPRIGIRSTSRPQITETRQRLGPLQVTGMFLCLLAPMATKSFSLSSPQSLQPPPYRYAHWERKAIFYYRNRRSENLAVEICAERCATGGMERAHRCVVRNLVFYSSHTTDSPAVQYSHSPISQYPFMQKRLWGKTSLLENR
jgi:hypothetical protein